MNKIEENVENWIEFFLPNLKHDYLLERGVFVEIVKEDRDYNLEIEVSHEEIATFFFGISDFSSAEKYRNVVETRLRESGIKVCFREDWEADLKD